jgi:hypothetical protein
VPSLVHDSRIVGAVFVGFGDEALTQRMTGLLRRREAGLVSKTFDDHGDREITQSFDTNVLMTVDRPEHCAFGDPRQRKPVLDAADRTRRGITAERERLAQALAKGGPEQPEIIRIARRTVLHFWPTTMERCGLERGDRMSP